MSRACDLEGNSLLLTFAMIRLEQLLSDSVVKNKMVIIQPHGSIFQGRWLNLL